MFSKEYVIKIKFIIVVLILAAFIVQADSAQADSVEITIPFDLETTALFGFFGSCGGTNFNDSYGLQPFSVHRAGTYVFAYISDTSTSGGASFQVHIGSFDPTDSSVNCIGVNGLDAELELAANTLYVVVGKSTDVSATGDITLSISGPGVICLGAHCAPGNSGGSVPANPQQAGQKANSRACDNNPGRAAEHRRENAPPCSGN